MDSINMAVDIITNTVFRLQQEVNRQSRLRELAELQSVKATDAISEILTAVASGDLPPSKRLGMIESALGQYFAEMREARDDLTLTDNDLISPYLHVESEDGS